MVDWLNHGMKKLSLVHDEGNDDDDDDDVDDGNYDGNGNDDNYSIPLLYIM